MAIDLNVAVTRFLDELNHPFRPGIERLRMIILGTGIGLTENIKWNGPNYSHQNEDRITMRIQIISFGYGRTARIFLENGPAKTQSPKSAIECNFPAFRLHSNI